jgi:hypothetical protein
MTPALHEVHSQGIEKQLPIDFLLRNRASLLQVLLLSPEVFACLSEKKLACETARNDNHHDEYSQPGQHGIEMPARVNQDHQHAHPTQVFMGVQELLRRPEFNDFAFAQRVRERKQEQYRAADTQVSPDSVETEPMEKQVQHNG